ncbi:galactokinase [bacterium]|nr:galactokinase [bacterium]
MNVMLLRTGRHDTACSGSMEAMIDPTMNRTRSMVMKRFEERFDEAPSHVVFTPGRVNLIGEHTDYNDGFVLPTALDLGVWIALRPREDNRVLLHSKGRKNPTELRLTDLSGGIPHWGKYVQGVAWALKEAGYTLHGWEGEMIGDVPAGAGLSSSAALEVAVARAFEAVAGETWLPINIARLAQKAENEWVGMPCGIMDQMTAAAAPPGKLMYFDCRTFDMQLLELPTSVELVVIDTMTRRSLTESRYRNRRVECEGAAKALQVQSLRDISAPDFGQKARQIDPLLRKRAMHVIHENARVQRAVQAILEGDPSALGVLLNAGHESLREDFEVTNDELNLLAGLAQEHDTCYGARMTGAGFGGCVVALVRKDEGERFVHDVGAQYESHTELAPWSHILR